MLDPICILTLDTFYLRGSSLEVIAINNPGINDGGLPGVTEADSGYILKKEPKGFPNRLHLRVKGKNQMTGVWPEQPQKWPFCELLVGQDLGGAA